MQNGGKYLWICFVFGVFGFIRMPGGILRCVRAE